MRRVAGLRILPLMVACSSFAPYSWCQSSVLVLSKLAQAQLDESASQVAKRIQEAQIVLNRPGIVVLDFANLNDGNRSRLGVALADQFSHALESYGSKFTIVSRTALQDFLRSHWLDGEETRNVEVAKWLADRLNAIGVVQGTIELLSDGQVKLLARVVGLGPVRLVEGRLAASANFRDLFDAAAPSYAPESENVDAEPGIYKFGDPGVVMPDHACIHCPDADYTDPARAAKYQGRVQLSAILGIDGRLSAIKVVKYAPFDLTDRAIEIVRTWRMKPCEKDGKPVATRISIEMTWHLL